MRRSLVAIARRGGGHRRCLRRAELEPRRRCSSGDSAPRWSRAGRVRPRRRPSRQRRFGGRHTKVQGWYPTRGNHGPNVKVVTDSASDLPESLATSLRHRRRAHSPSASATKSSSTASTSRPTSSGRSARVAETLPETAAPSPGAFQAAYERALSDGCDGVVVLTLSSMLSATRQSAYARRRSSRRTIDVRVVDTAERLDGRRVSRHRSGRAGEDRCVDRRDRRARPTSWSSARASSRPSTRSITSSRAAASASAGPPRPGALDQAADRDERRRRRRGRSPAHSCQGPRRRGETWRRVHAPLRRLALIHGARERCRGARGDGTRRRPSTPIIVTDIGPVVGTHGGPGIIGLTWMEA